MPFPAAGAKPRVSLARRVNKHRMVTLRRFVESNPLARRIGVRSPRRLTVAFLQCKFMENPANPPIIVWREGLARPDY